MKLNIADKSIGPGRPTFVIAEIGVNHDGSVERALELVHIAHACGADAIKLQVFRANTLMHEASAFAEYQKAQVDDLDPRAMLRRYELSVGDVKRVVAEAKRCGLIALATPFSPSDVDVIDELNLPALKIASPDLINKPLLSRALRGGRPLLLSTGAATRDEVIGTTQWLRERGAQFALLHCISSYPTPTESTNLCWISELERATSVPIGYSDHSTEVAAGALAVAFGACVVEKHLTYDRGARGPDHFASADPAQFAEYVRLVRVADAMRGTAGKRVLDVERDVRRVSRQSLVLARDVTADAILTHDDLTVQRPGTGISASEIDHVIGRRVGRALSKGAMLSVNDLSKAHAHAA